MDAERTSSAAWVDPLTASEMSTRQTTSAATTDRREVVLVCGSRDWNGTVLLKERLASLDPHRTMILHGGARGVDTDTAKLAASFGLPSQSYPPDYDSFGKAAPHVRNDEMLKHADRVLAFWDGKSPGTKSVIDKARKAGIPTEVIRL